MNQSETPSRNDGSRLIWCSPYL